MLDRAAIIPEPDLKPGDALLAEGRRLARDWPVGPSAFLAAWGDESDQRLAAEKGPVEMVVERQIYASHFLDVGQTVTAILPVQEGTLLFHVHRTWVDRWTGPGMVVGAKRKVGNELIESQLTSMTDQLRLCEGQ